MNHAERLVRLQGLYGIVDDGSGFSHPPLLWARALALGGARVLQLRFKRTPPRAALQLARVIRAELPDLLLIVNDRPDLALLCGADGVHVGEGDLSPADARALLGPHLLVGATARTAAQGHELLSQGADHLGVGPIFSSSTKKLDLEPLGLATLAALCAELKPAPIVAISGIQADNIREVARSGATAAAVVSAVGCARDPEAAARALTQAFFNAGP